MTSTEIVAGAQQERYVLLAQAARNHLSNVRSEADRYARELEHIENVFTERITPVPDVPDWINDSRKADITLALRLLHGAADSDLEAWLAKTSVPGPGFNRAQVRMQLTLGLSDPAELYDAWLAARQLLTESRDGKP